MRIFEESTPSHPSARPYFGNPLRCSPSLCPLPPSQQARSSFFRQTTALRKKVHSSYQRSMANVLTKMRTMHLLEDNFSGRGKCGELSPHF